MLHRGEVENGSRVLAGLGPSLTGRDRSIPW